MAFPLIDSAVEVLRAYLSLIGAAYDCSGFLRQFIIYMWKNQCLVPEHVLFGARMAVAALTIFIAAGGVIALLYLLGEFVLCQVLQVVKSLCPCTF